MNDTRRVFLRLVLILALFGVGFGGLDRLALAKGSSHAKKPKKSKKVIPTATPLPGETYQIQFDQMQLLLSEPRVVARAEKGEHCSYPELNKFAGGTVMLTYALGTELARVPMFNNTSAAAYLSTDQGKTFAAAGYKLEGAIRAGMHEPRQTLPDGRLVGPSSGFMLTNQAHQARQRFATEWQTFSDAGKHLSVEPDGTSIEGLPREVRTENTGKGYAGTIEWTGGIVALGGKQWVSACAVRFQGDKRFSTVALGSEDQGKHWRYLGTVAGPDAIPSAEEGFHAPSLIRLASGDLMCVGQVGSFNQRLGRAYSADGGKSWSPVDQLPAAGVAPCLLQLKDGTTLLSTGRPGLTLWLAIDPRAQKWQSVDLKQFHNGVAPLLDHIIADPLKAGGLQQTTGHTALVETTENRLLLAYDRLPVDDPGDPPTGERIFMVELTVRRAGEAERSHEPSAPASGKAQKKSKKRY